MTTHTKHPVIMPAPDRVPITLSALYRRYTRDVKQKETNVRDVILTDNVERRRAITLYLKGYSYNAIAEATGVSHGAIMSRIRLAMKRAYKILNGVSRRAVARREFGVAVPRENGGVEVVAAFGKRERARAVLCLHQDGAIVVTAGAGGCYKGQSLNAGEWLLVAGPVVCRKSRKSKGE